MKNRAQTFKITSESKALLEAMWKELVAIGYIDYNYRVIGTGCISLQIITVLGDTTIDGFKMLYFGSEPGADKTFTLPQQYDEVLAFAKEQLSDKYWAKEPEFKVGDKVIVIPSDNGFSDYKRAIGHIFSLDKDCIIGIEKGGVFVEPNQKFAVNYRAKDVRLATAKEIEDYEDNLLIEEAKKRYPVGTVVNQKSAYGGLGQTLRVQHNNASINLYCGYKNVSIGNVGVYNTQHNIWAEIVKEEAAPEIMINGYKADFSTKGIVKFGCQQLTLDFITQAKKLAVNNICLVDYNGEDLTDEVNEIYEYLTKQK